MSDLSHRWLVIDVVDDNRTYLGSGPLFVHGIATLTRDNLLRVCDAKGRMQEVPAGRVSPNLLAKAVLSKLWRRHSREFSLQAG